MNKFITIEKILPKLDGLPKDISKDIEATLKKRLPKCNNIRDFNKLRGEIVSKYGVDIGLKENINSTTTITTTTSTTSTTLNPAGDFTEDLVIEPIGGYYYIWCCNGKKGISEAYPVKTEPKDNRNKSRIKYFGINIDGEEYKFDKKPLDAVLFSTPSKEEAEAWVEGEFKPRNIDLIFKDMVKAYRVAFDLRKKTNAIILALHDLTSWLRDILDSFFFIGLDATRGAGKTCLLKAKSILSYHGKVAGDLTAPFLARTIEKQKLTLLVDEIDQLNKDKKNELEGIMRKAQRRNNPFLRINPNTYEPEQFHVHGAHGFSFRSKVEDALSHRSLKLRLVVSKEVTLPVINYYIETLLKPLHKEILFYYLENQHTLRNSEVSSSQVVEVMRDSGEDCISEIRNKLFSIFTKDFDEKEVELMKKLIGRNIELCFVSLKATHILGLDIFDEIEEALTDKQEEEDVPESLQLEALKEFIRYLFDTNKQFDEFFLKKGDFAGCFYYSKHKAYYEYVNWCKEIQKIYPIGTPNFNKFLKDLGFSEGYNIKNQKVDGTPVRCLIYSKEIQKLIGISEENSVEVEHEYVKGSKNGKSRE